MNRFSSPAALRKPFPARVNLFFAFAIIASLVLAVCPIRAEDPEGQYLQIFDLIQQGDLSRKNGQIDNALARYREAQIALAKYQRTFPDRNAKSVAYRLNYVTAQIAALAPQATSTATTNEHSGPPSANQTTATSSGSTQVKLIEQGAEPRKELRFHPKPGDKESMVLTIKMGVERQVGETPGLKIKLPGIKYSIDVSIQDVAQDGDIKYEVVISDASILEDPDVIAQVADAMRASIEAMKGLSGTGIISSRGINKSIDMKAPPGADAQVLQSVEQAKEMMSYIVLALPEEAVGVGAKWEARMTAKSQGMTINRTVSSELTALEGDQGTVKSTILESAGNQKIPNPMMPGTQVNLTRMTGNGSGEITFNLAQLVSQPLNAQIHSEVFMALSAGGQKQNMSMKLDQSFQLAPK